MNNNKTKIESRRRNWSVEEKIGILRAHFAKSKILDTCNEHRVHPNLVSNWLKTVLEAGAVGLSGEGRRESKKQAVLISKYEAALAKKNEVIAELSGEVLSLKKPRGET